VKALVTGAAGFVGSHLVDALLARGDTVVAFDHRLRGKCLTDAVLARTAAIESDIFDGAAVALAAQGCAAIFHCAAMVGVDAYTSQPARTMEVEEVGLRNVCAAAIAQGNTCVVFASSSAVYGHADGRALDEALVVAPVSNYGIAKRFGELYLAAEYAEHGLRSAALRIFNIYGPRQDDRLVIPRFIRQALAGEPIVIYGDGGQTRDFVYVGDAVAAAMACAEQVAGFEIINVCSGRDTAIAALADRIITLTGSRSSIARRAPPVVRTAFEIERSVGSRDKLARLIALPPTGLDDGLQRTIAAWVADRADGRRRSG
jgi:UDP-glucose 4-epimerase